MKRLVICCDGTWNDADHNDITNVSRIARAIRPVAADGTEQIVYYQSGVGTEGSAFDRLTGGALGTGLTRNVRLAYAFIVDNYFSGDEIFLFGFSRGAYTARSVGGLLNFAGIIQKTDLDYFLFLWTAYKMRSKTGDLEIEKLLENKFPNRFLNFPIKCIGVWETVGSLGIPKIWFRASIDFYRFLDTDLGQKVEFAFQALALDEERRPFVPTFWTRPAGAPPCQVLEQVWFAGVHSNVGGGYSEHGLSDVALAWMAGKVAPLLELDLDYLSARQDRSAGWALGRLYDSFKWWYLLTGRRTPRQPLTSTTAVVRNEKIHESVSVRFAAPTAVPEPYHSDALKPPIEQVVLAPLTPVEKSLSWPNCPPPAGGSHMRPVGCRFLCKVLAARSWNRTGLQVVKGTRYRFTAVGLWRDCRTVCGPDGYQSGNALHRWAARYRRAKEHPWFALIGAIEREPRSQFLIGAGITWTATATGALYCFANDVRVMYFNNFRAIVLLVEY